MEVEAAQSCQQGHRSGHSAPQLVHREIYPQPLLGQTLYISLSLSLSLPSLSLSLSLSLSFCLSLSLYIPLSRKEVIQAPLPSKPKSPSTRRGVLVKPFPWTGNPGKTRRRVNSQYLNCETKTSLFSRFSANVQKMFADF